MIARRLTLVGVVSLSVMMGLLLGSAVAFAAGAPSIEGELSRMLAPRMRR